ncbi:hypothetical protein RD792_001034 [Penstemon davidsonii]|uniref:Protein OSB1, mitochondrial n=1 Tax=Penstemon davidsonii TaxID=160366 RepID=A0ABR0DNI7_9LAMI|nr:hypothetical protein RD792_001034 [Penstemon davidsonii]
MGTTLRILLSRLNAAAAASNYSRLFSSSAALIRRPWTYLSDDSELSDGESSVYKRALKLKPPSTVIYNETFHNSVSLIGVIDLPFKEINTARGGFGVHTFLRVRTSTDTCRHFRVMLKFWNEIAEMYVEHLKPNDFVYVSGLLGSYVKANEDGNLIRNHEVIVKEINFVAKDGLSPSFQKFIKFEAGVSAEDIKKKRRDRLHLWQIFFSNPYEWWDDRNNKTKPNSPDFKHKDTGEILYLQENDPPWIKQQLKLQDSRLNGDSPREHKISQHLSSFDYDG